ncbi:uncharacterized protein LOC105018570 [Esox lucius]|uniref:uncharacterized protein LOC105018570 n=1 Tax=Esox lucius TaxID=8010 RepID=UPI001476F498|nr:uncharacterized protein LOC105018570 [Esox lucius]
MEGRSIENHFKPPERKYLDIVPTLPMWIIEYAWAHRMMDILEALDPCMWPDEDLLSLNLDEPWRIRVEAAQAYSIMKTRDIKRFERVMEFLDVTYKLLPQLVPPIKHMKIMFGLKTMVIMWMLREDQGMVNTVVKTMKFFPSRLPQYHDCSRHQMYLMRKHHQEFKALAKTLATELSVRKAYIKDLMDHQYGECYAQKLEERLMHYIQELESELQSDTYFDQLLKQGAPKVNEEELLWPIISSTNIAASLKRLLHCAHSSSRCELSHDDHKVGIGSGQKSGISWKWEGPAVRSPKERTLIGQSQLHRTCPDTTQGICQHSPPERSNSLVIHHACAAEQGLNPSTVSPLLLEEEGDSDGDHGSRGRTEVEVSPHSEEVHEASPLQLCSKHQKWVRSILLDCSEELQCGEGDTPVYSQGSISTLSLDLTPSLNTPFPAQHLTRAKQNPFPPHPVALSQPRAHSEQASRTPRDKLGMSLESRAFLLQSEFLQPFVRLRKLTHEECSIAAELRGTSTPLSEEQSEDDEEVDEGHVDETSVYSYYDVNKLYSSDSSSDEPGFTQDSDPDYVPHQVKETRKRRTSV